VYCHVTFVVYLDGQRRETHTMSIPTRPEVPAVAFPPHAEEKPNPQRNETDVSLRSERETTDAREEGRVLDDADRVVNLARARADAVLTEAREKADQDLPSGSEDGVAKDRDEADEVLEDERAAADASLRRERQDAARRLSALLPVARNKTDRNLLTERAAEDAALGSRDDFLAMVSHDLSNLLGGIILSAEMLARLGSTTPDGRRIATGTHRIQLYAARMRRLIGDLTDVTSLGAGKLSITSTPSDQGVMVAEAIETFQILAAEKRIELEAECAGAPLSVVCDHGRIVQVLVNLIGNAVKFTPDGGRVSVVATGMGAEVLFSVTDSGPGIPADLLEAVFERFWQVGAHDQRGLGLGLYIARGIVEAHGGRIWAESRVGHGSSFHFTLPVGSPSTGVEAALLRVHA
jgi:signal transduction histidine kinase